MLDTCWKCGRRSPDPFWRSNFNARNGKLFDGWMGNPSRSLLPLPSAPLARSRARCLVSHGLIRPSLGLAFLSTGLHFAIIHERLCLHQNHPSQLTWIDPLLH
jgi:hypothetical protein